MTIQRVVLGIIMCCVILNGDSRCAAQTEQGRYSITPMIGGYVFEGNQELKDAPTVGLGLGYGITKHWSTKLFFNYIDSEKKMGDKEAVRGYLYHLDGLYDFRPGNKLVPYVALGVGGITLDPEIGHSTNDVLMNYGAGLKYFLKDNLALFGDARHIVTINDGENNLLYTAGLTFLAGGAEEKKVAPSLDDDGDGVENRKDNCPDTPGGIRVDSQGCPLDTDKDGVADHLDNCADTPKGVAVDANGCPKDSDGDGVSDYQDKCANTPRGVGVNANGCPKDSDGDGVSDYQDKCPHSAKGVMVDEDGCALKYTLYIEFDLEKADIRPDYHKDLLNAAEFIKNYKAPKILVAGHTDETGTAEYNQTLSEQRAQSVAKYLQEHFQVSASRLAVRGYGKTRPIADNTTWEGRQKNRRVEIICCTLIPED